MLKCLVLALVALTGAFAVDVTIDYEKPVIRFTLPVFDEGISGVTFHFTIKNEEYRGKGTQTSEGWEYHYRNDNLHETDSVTAFAQVFDSHGSLKLITKPSTITLGGTYPVAQAPPRHIRGVAFFREDFNSLNTANWRYEVSMYGGYNGEFQVYTNDPKNVYTSGGNLYLKPMPTVNDARFDENYLHTGVMDINQLFGYCTISDINGCWRSGTNGILPPVMSGKIMSNPTIKYGEVEVRARIPKGDWIWPAIWMLPQNSVYGTWPRSGEIDIMESRGNTGDIGIGTVTSTLHWGPSPGENRFSLTHGERKTGSWHDDFHTWRLLWTPDHLQTFVDNQQIMYVDGNFWQKGGFSGNNLWSSGGTMAPFDQDFYLILNVAVGGTSGFFPDGISYGSATKPWNNGANNAPEQFWNAHNTWYPTWQGDAAAMLIDYVEFRHL